MTKRQILILLLDLSLFPLGAAITRTALGSNQEKPQKANTSWTPLTSISISSGDWLFVGFTYDVGGVIPATAPTWNGISADGSFSGGSEVVTSMTGGTSILYRWSAGAIGAGGTGDIVFTYSSSSAHAMFATKVSGLSSSALDVSSSGTGNSNSPSDTAAGTNQANEIFIGSLGTVGPIGDAAGTWSNSWSAGQRNGTTGGSSGSNQTIQEGYRIVSATESSQAALTGITARVWGIVHATYKASTGGATTPHGLLIHGVGMAQMHRQHLNHYVCNLAPCGDMVWARR